MGSNAFCKICGEGFTKDEKNGMAGDNSIAEMFDPKDGGTSSYVVHGMCGVMAEWEMA